MYLLHRHGFLSFDFLTLDLSQKAKKRLSFDFLYFCFLSALLGPDWLAFYAAICKAVLWVPTRASVLLYLLLCSVVFDSSWPQGLWPPGSSVHGLFQARILERVAISYSRGPSQPRDHTCICHISRMGRRILYHWASLFSSVTCSAFWDGDLHRLCP